MSLSVNIYYEWVDKKLNGSSHYRDNDIPITIEIDSANNLSIIGTTLSLVLTHYSSATPTVITKVPVIQEANINRIVANVKLLDTELDTENSPLPNVPVAFNYKLNATLPDSAMRTIAEGSFTSIPVV